MDLTQGEFAPEPSVSSPSAASSLSSMCSRALMSTLWSAAFAFFSLMADSWPASKARLSFMPPISWFGKLRFWLSLAPLAPMFAISVLSKKLFTTLRFRQIHRRSTNPELVPDTISMSNKLRSVIDNILVMLFGRNQARGFLKRTRIVANTYVGLGIRPSTKFPPAAHVMWHDRVEENNVFDALTFGQKTDENSCLIELTETGKLALLESSILPDYRQLRFLDDRSGIATLIISIQAIGYVISIFYRVSLHLAVSPIEAIGFAYSVVVIVHSIVHNVAMLCQNSLVIYLNPTQEQELLEKCESNRWSEVDDVNCGRAETVGVFVVGSMVMIFTVLVAWPLFRMAISVMQFTGIEPFLFYIIMQFLFFRKFTRSLFEQVAISSFISILTSLWQTIIFWKIYKFDSCTPSLIHIFPFLG